MPAPPPSEDFNVLADMCELDGRRVLDIGCGTGRLVRELAAAGAQPIGLEISDAQLSAAIESDPGQDGRYVVGVAEALPFEDDSMDLVILMKTLHHVPADHMAGALREAGRVARPGGAVYVAEPTLEGTFFPLSRLVEDETVARGLARDAVAASPMPAEATVEYETRPVFADFAAFRRRLLEVNPERAPAIDEREDELRTVFAERSAVDPSTGDHVFVQPIRADLLRAP